MKHSFVSRVMAASALLLLASTGVQAGNDCVQTPGNQCIPKFVLVDPSSGIPYAASASSVGSVTGAGTNGTLAQAIQGITGGVPVTIGPSTVTLTQTVKTLTAATSASLIPPNTSRKSLRWMNTGTNPMTCVPGTGPAVAGVGMNYDPGSSTSNQGGGTSFEGGPVPSNAFTCISTGGTSVTVWEGN